MLKRKIHREEIIADLVFLVVCFIVSSLIIFIFDIHWNFYPDGKLFPPEKFIFQDKSIYLWGGLLGAILGFFIIKLFLFGLKEEEIVWKDNQNFSLKEKSRTLKRNYNTKTK